MENPECKTSLSENESHDASQTNDLIIIDTIDNKNKLISDFEKKLYSSTQKFN